MRLLRVVERLEASAAAAREVAPEDQRWSVVWTSRDVRVDASALGVGDFVAVDVVVSMEGDGFRCEKTSERITADVRDLGVVYRDGGAQEGGFHRIGRVVSIDGERVDWERDAVGGGAA